MIKTNIIKWETAKGTKVEIKCECELFDKETTQIDGGYGGFITDEACETSSLDVTINGKNFGSVFLEHLVESDNVKEIGKRNALKASGIPYAIDSPDVLVGVPGKNHKDIMTTVEKMRAELRAENPAIVQKLDKMEQFEKNRKAGEYEEIITQAESQNEILTKDELKEKSRQYNNLYNESGEGYNPYSNHATKEYYDFAKNELRKLQEVK